jgi:hypothetical protein
VTITVTQFRSDFPAFANTQRYPDGFITYWLNYVYNLVNPTAWGTMTDTAAELWVAHLVAVERRAIDESLRGIPGEQPGQMTGPVSSKSSDKNSVSYSAEALQKKSYGDLNLTTYGVRFAGLIEMFGAGPIQVNIGASPPWTGGAWQGPPPWPGWFSS